MSAERRAAPAVHGHGSKPEGGLRPRQSPPSESRGKPRPLTACVTRSVSLLEVGRAAVEGAAARMKTRSWNIIVNAQRPVNVGRAAIKPRQITLFHGFPSSKRSFSGSPFSSAWATSRPSARAPSWLTGTPSKSSLKSRSQVGTAVQCVQVWQAAEERLITLHTTAVGSRERVEPEAVAAVGVEGRAV